MINFSGRWKFSSLSSHSNHRKLELLESRLLFGRSLLGFLGLCIIRNPVFGSKEPVIASILPFSGLTKVLEFGSIICYKRQQEMSRTKMLKNGWKILFICLIVLIPKLSAAYWIRILNFMMKGTKTILQGTMKS